MFRYHSAAETGLFCLFLIIFNGDTLLTVSHHDKGPSGCFGVEASKKIESVMDFYIILHSTGHE